MWIFFDRKKKSWENSTLFRYKFCGSLPNHLDDKDVMTDTIGGNLGGTLPHKKRSLGVHFSDGGPTGTLDLVKHRSQDSLDENDPWRYAIRHLCQLIFLSAFVYEVGQNIKICRTVESSINRVLNEFVVN